MGDHAALGGILRRRFVIADENAKLVVSTKVVVLITTLYY